jgi:hypothetical protein
MALGAVTNANEEQSYPRGRQTDRMADSWFTNAKHFCRASGGDGGGGMEGNSPNFINPRVESCRFGWASSSVSGRARVRAEVPARETYRPFQVGELAVILVSLLSLCAPHPGPQGASFPGDLAVGGAGTLRTVVPCCPC